MVITINRPEARNAVNGAVSIVVGDALEEAHDNPDVRAVVITGAGDKSLCAGADLKAIARRENPYHPHHGEWGSPVTGTISSTSRPAPRSVARPWTTVPSQRWPATWWWPTSTPNSGLPEVKRGLIAAAGGVPVSR